MDQEQEVINPFTGRMIKVNGPTYKKLMELGELPIINRKSKDDRDWSRDKPAKGQPSKNLLSKCGERCFLKPDTLQYPICQKVKSSNQCTVDCRALLSAKKKAQKSGNNELEKMATDIAINKRCEWANIPEIKQEINYEIKPEIKQETKSEKKAIPRCNSHKVEPFSKCMTLAQEELLPIATECDKVDQKGRYRRDLDKMNKKQLCGYIITHYKKRVTKGFSKEDYIQLYELSKEYPRKLPPFMETIANNTYPDIRDKKYILSYIYLYLIIKYRDYGILYINKYNLNDEAVWFCGESKENEMGEKIIEDPYLEFPEDFVSDLEQHPNRYLFLELNLLECEEEADPHANLLIFDKEEKTVSRWESNIGLYHHWKQELLDSELEKFAMSIGYQYKTTYEVCSSNFNTLGEIATRQMSALKDESVSSLSKSEIEELKSYELDGPCQLFEALFIEFSFYNDRIRNTNNSIDSINRDLIDILLNSKYTIDEFMYNYRNYILGELHQFILEEFSYEGSYDPNAITQFIKDNEAEILDILTN
jgi:hypothetical protein